MMPLGAFRIKQPLQTLGFETTKNESALHSSLDSETRVEMFRPFASRNVLAFPNRLDDFIPSNDDSDFFVSVILIL